VIKETSFKETFSLKKKNAFSACDVSLSWFFLVLEKSRCLIKKSYFSLKRKTLFFVRCIASEAFLVLLPKRNGDLGAHVNLSWEEDRSLLVIRVFKLDKDTFPKKLSPCTNGYCFINKKNLLPTRDEVYHRGTTLVNTSIYMCSPL
jgi:hypothetical protein